jgi:hypothetical protein
MPHPLFEKHRATLDAAVDAIHTRGYWAAYNEMPSPKTYGGSAGIHVKSLKNPAKQLI